jgi:hypothetical protein
MMGSGVKYQPTFTKCYYDGEIKKDEMSETCNSSGRGEKCNLYSKTSVRKPKENEQLWPPAVEKSNILHCRESNPSRPALSPSPRRRWEYNIKMYYKAVKWDVD